MLAFSAETASADRCSDIRAQLAAASANTGSSARYNRYADAARRQAAEIRKVERARRSLGCRFNGSRQCRTLANSLSQMQANLADIEWTRDQAKPRRDNARIKALQTRFNSYGCNRPTRVARVEPEKRVTSNGRRVIVRQGAEPARNDAISADVPGRTALPHLSGSYRTMCVRTCDGYYFPISFATTPEFFGRDEAACRAMCPAAETKLYRHRVPDEESAAMVSLEGEPYAALPTAFLYRQSGRSEDGSSCSCGKPQTLASLAPDNAEDRPLNTASIPVPAKRPELPAASSEEDSSETTLAPADTASPVTPDTNDAEEPGRRRAVRVVGPQFLPDLEEAIDLRSPARTSGP
ncbi:DUF2865 domain-containing protein [Oricola sp.]|uniref:DUF2865 domain-containing protein n=1 Tax=Oricola sp. TaxID=1979950 RepID=UPI003BA9415E